MKNLISLILLAFGLYMSGQTIPGTQITSPIVPNDCRDNYPTHIDTLGMGGYMVVSTLTERDNIKTSRRKVGMMVGVVEDGHIYTLVDGITNMYWKCIYFGDAEDLLINGFITITQKSGASGKTALLQVLDSAGYNRLLITDKGLIVVGSQHISTVNVDGMALIGRRCSLGGKNSVTIGYNAYNKGDTSVTIGCFIDSLDLDNQVTIGNGASSTMTLKNRKANSIALGANDTIPALTISGKFIQTVIGANVSSATTITPTANIFHVTGTTAIDTINIPWAGFRGQISIIPDGAFTTTTAGNIKIASTAVVSRVLIMTYDPSQAKWYPTY